MLTIAQRSVLAPEVRRLRVVMHEVSRKRDKILLITQVRLKAREIFALGMERVLENFMNHALEIGGAVRAWQTLHNVELQEFAGPGDPLDDFLDDLMNGFGLHGEEVDLFREGLFHLLFEAAKKGAEASQEQLALMGGFRIQWDLPEEWIRSKAAEFYEIFKGVDHTTTQLIRDKLAGCIREGKSVQDMMAEIQKVAKMSDYRAEMIARTEVTRAYRQGSVECDKAIGVKEWNLEGCDPTCEICGPIMAGGPYIAEDVAANEAELHPNCKGDWIPVIPEDWEPFVLETEEE